MNTPTSAPVNEASTSVTSTARHPSIAPTIASIFTSPIPMPSTPVQPEICFADQPEHAAADDDADQGGLPAGRQERAEREADHHARQRDAIGQDAVIQVDERQDDQHGGEHQPHDEQRAGLEEQTVQRKDDAGERFNGRIARRDPGAGRTRSGRATRSQLTTGML